MQLSLRSKRTQRHQVNEVAISSMLTTSRIKLRFEQYCVRYFFNKYLNTKILSVKVFQIQTQNILYISNTKYRLYYYFDVVYTWHLLRS